MPAVLTDLAQATPDWLTMVLRGCGVLRHGRVMGVDQRRVGASSQVAYLTVRYDARAPDEAPRQLVLKLADPDLERRMPRRNRAEVAFYAALANEPRPLPVVRCYAAAYAAGDPDRFQLLLADPSATTHRASPYSAAPPTLPQCEQIVDTLALVHARCWADRSLGARLEAARPDERHTGALTDAFAAWAGAVLPRFLADLGDRLPAERRALYARIGAVVPARLVVRQASGAALTLVQGDVHVGNFLYPRDPATDVTYVIDWKRAGVTFAASDLAYMMALYWFPPIRAQREQLLLRRYHEDLLALGVTGYAWADLWVDYRLAVLRQFYEAVWGWSVRQNSALWWNHLERITLAITELRCLDVV